MRIKPILGPYNSERTTKWTHLAIAAAATSLLAASLSWAVSGRPSAHPDFAVLWAALQLPNIYDWQALKDALRWPASQSVAFIYPPSSLPLLAPFAALPMRFALCLWAAISGAALALAARSVLAPLLLLTPAVLWALPGGQTSLLLGSALLGATLLVSLRPALAGVILGCAIALKPQLSLVIPAALLIDRRWLPLFVAGGTFAALTLLSALVFGWDKWIVWGHQLQAFLELHRDTANLRRAELAYGIPLWCRAAVLIVGTWLAARALRRDDPVAAFALAISAALLGSTHAMGYELAMFAPAYIALVRRGGLTSWMTALIILLPLAMMAFPVARPFGWAAVVALAFGLVADQRGKPTHTASQRELGCS